MTESLARRLGAEFLGTFVLVFVGCGAAILDAGNKGIDLLGVAFAFGIAVMVMIYAVGAISGGHFNPAVTVGLAVAKRFPWSDVVAYVITQVVAAIAASLVLLGVASGQDGFSAKASGFASNGYGDHSPAHYKLAAVLLVEVVLTAIFLYVIIGATDVRAPAGFAGIAIGFTLVMIHIVSIPVSNTSVNPARSSGPALIQHGWALGQLWLFWLAPLIGAAIAGATYRAIVGERAVSPEEPLASEATV
ncbi:MAG TPA: aquaporin Z [Jatrophihabitans sp.]|jgi:aquaporin Z|uniref:aquaporin Z n=1 Tax=Jatrophihabitans sp. TaxID=1932789 RepID=UPI002E0ABF54|nr:aquaporin Z [Jatrophihabitans sp.]